MPTEHARYRPIAVVGSNARSYTVRAQGGWESPTYESGFLRVTAIVYDTDELLSDSVYYFTRFSLDPG